MSRTPETNRWDVGPVNGVNVRTLEDEDDVQEFARAHGLAWRAAYDDVLPESVISEVPVEIAGERLSEWYDRYAPDSDRVLVAEVDGVVRGYAYFRWEETKPFVGPGEAGLKEIYVHPEYWGEGIGTALLERGLELLPAGVSALKLEVLADNDVARSFYEGRGFEPVDTRSTDVGGVTVEVVVYELSL